MCFRLEGENDVGYYWVLIENSRVLSDNDKTNPYKFSFYRDFVDTAFAMSGEFSHVV